MSLLTFNELCIAIGQGVLKAPADFPEPFNTIPLDNINAASIDVRLGTVFHREFPSDHTPYRVRLGAKQAPDMQKIDLTWGQEYDLLPGEFILAQTVEEFYLPNNIAAEFRLKSSAARAGLDQALAVWCDPGWAGSVLTIELRNNLRGHTLALEVGMKIGQIILYSGKPVPDHASYSVRGQYNNDKEATQSKGVR